MTVEGSLYFILTPSYYVIKLYKDATEIATYTIKYHPINFRFNYGGVRSTGAEGKGSVRGENKDKHKTRRHKESGQNGKTLRSGTTGKVFPGCAAFLSRLREFSCPP